MVPPVEPSTEPAVEPAAPAAAAGAAAPRPRRRAAVAVAYLVYLWLLVELGSFAGLVALKRLKGIEYEPGAAQELLSKQQVGIAGHLEGRDSYMVFDRELGWTLGKERARRRYRSNAAGIRANREYDPQPPPGVLRLAAFGDSFTHASDVANSQTWERKLEELRPQTEVLNFGVPGYGPDQAYLRYRRDGLPFRPHVVLIGYMSENIGRVVNTFRPFYFHASGMAFAKPRFVLRGDGLELVPNPMPELAGYRELLDHPERVLPRLGEHDFYYQRQSRRSRLDFLPSARLWWIVRDRYLDQPTYLGREYNPRSEGFQVSVRLLDRFYRDALAEGSLPVIVLFPQHRDIGLRQRGEAVTYRPLLAELRRGGYRVADLGDAFARFDPEGRLIAKKFIHYPPHGNNMVARYLVEWLAQQGIAGPDAVGSMVAAERRRLGVASAARP